LSLKVLITGAAGFVGRYVSKEFSEQGYEVVGMGWGKFPEYAEWGLSTWHEAEVSFEMLCEYAGKPDVIVHCAGGASVGASVEHPRQDFCLTVDATSHLLEYIRIHSPNSKLVYPSSAAVYGQAKVVPIPETAALKPVSPYGVHKLMAEQLCELYAQRYHISIAMVRLFSIYGDGLRKQLLWDACNKISHGEMKFFGSGEEVRDWLHITDAAKLLRIAANHASKACPVVNGGSGEGLKVKEILQLIVQEMGIKNELVFSSIPKEGDPDVLLAESTKMRQWFAVTLLPSTDGVKKYVQWYKQCR